MRIWVCLFALLMFSSLASAQDTVLVQRIASSIHAGHPLESIDDMPKIDAASHEANLGLRGCKPELNPRSTKSYVKLDFLCTPRDAPAFVRTVHLSFDGNDLESVWTSIFPMAMGPTEEAKGTANISTKRLFGRFSQAVQEGGDLTLGGLVPLLEVQSEMLRSLDSCDWTVVRARFHRDRQAILDCPNIDRQPQYMVTMIFSDDDRPRLVDIQPGQLRRSIR